MVQNNEYDTFKDLGKYDMVPVGYTNIREHLLYYLKYYGLHKSRLVDYGNLTHFRLKIVYSGFFLSVVFSLFYLLLSLKK